MIFKLLIYYILCKLNYNVNININIKNIIKKYNKKI